MANTRISDLSAITTVSDTDNFVVASGGASKKITGANLKASPWNLYFNKTGTSFADFTIDNGAWSSNGTVITINAGTTLSRCRVTAVVPTAGCVLEVEAKGTSLTGTAIKMGLLWGWDGAGNNGCCAYLDSTDTTPESGGRFRQENDSLTSSIDINLNWNAGQWYKIRVHNSGYMSDGYVDGTLYSCAGSIPNRDSRYVGLFCQGGVFEFRNYKMWTPALPS